MRSSIMSAGAFGIVLSALVHCSTSHEQEPAAGPPIRIPGSGSEIPSGHGDGTGSGPGSGTGAPEAPVGAWQGFVAKCLYEASMPTVKENSPYLFLPKITCSETIAAETFTDLEQKLTAWAKKNCPELVDVRGGMINVGEEPCRLSNSFDFRRSNSAADLDAMRAEAGVCVAKPGLAYGSKRGVCRQAAGN